MLRLVDAILRRLPSPVIFLLCLLYIGSLAAVDYSTGYEFSFSLLYILPVAAATWYIGRGPGLTLAVICSGTWLGTDWAAGHRYSHPLFHLWNAGIGLGFFLVITYLVSVLRARLRFESLMARLDPLTAAGNPRAFAETAHAVLELARRHGHPTTLGFIDLDDFKRVNDERGHASGDRALQLVAATIRDTVRSSDLVARLGGDEFAVLLPETGRDGAERVFTALRRGLAEQNRQRDRPVTCSIGVAVFREAPASTDEALRWADALMYRVKTSGKDAMLIEELPPPEHTEPALRGSAVGAGEGA
jgi:diguanylate cyclase (GGDEF)-like protein